jgi:hypothetical protein
VNERNDLEARNKTMTPDLKEETSMNEELRIDLATLNTELIEKDTFISDLKKSSLISLQRMSPCSNPC